MAASRPAASLRPTLLARKGGARPAMRTAQSHDFAAAGDLDDLGWNDMGWNEQVCNDVGSSDLGNDAPTLVLASSQPHPATKVHRAAFTLRLDSQRHFRLRLASTLRDCSAQALVTEALDRFLDTIPQLDTVASKARRPSDHS